MDTDVRYLRLPRHLHCRHTCPAHLTDDRSHAKVDRETAHYNHVTVAAVAPVGPLLIGLAVPARAAEAAVTAAAGHDPQQRGEVAGHLLQLVLHLA